MAIDGNRIKKKILSRKPDRGAVTLYISKEVYEDFRRHCGRMGASDIVEELMREYMASSDGPLKSKYRNQAG